MSGAGIPAATVEVAAKGMFDVRDDPYDLDEWGDLDSIAREPYVQQARAALEAAGPLIRAAALRDAADHLEYGNPIAQWLCDRADEMEPADAE